MALEGTEEEGCDVEFLLRRPDRALMSVLLGPNPLTQFANQEVIYRFNTLSTETCIIGFTNLVSVLVVGALLMQVAVVFPQDRKEGDRVRNSLPSVFLQLRGDIAWVQVGRVVEREVTRHTVKPTVFVQAGCQGSGVLGSRGV